MHSKIVDKKVETTSSSLQAQPTLGATDHEGAEEKTPDPTKQMLTFEQASTILKFYFFLSANADIKRLLGAEASTSLQEQNYQLIMNKNPHLMLLPPPHPM